MVYEIGQRSKKCEVVRVASTLKNSISKHPVVCVPLPPVIIDLWITHTHTLTHTHTYTPTHTPTPRGRRTV